jgi:hypothetical protein
MAKLSLNKSNKSLVQPKAVLEPIVIEKEVIKEVIKEVRVEIPVIQTVTVEKIVEKIVNVPVEVKVQEVVEVIKEVPVEVIKVVKEPVYVTSVEYIDKIKVHYKIPAWAKLLIIVEGLMLLITNI